MHEIGPNRKSPYDAIWALLGLLFPWLVRGRGSVTKAGRRREDCDAGSDTRSAFRSASSANRLQLEDHDVGEVRKMSEEKKAKKGLEDVEELKEILSVVSDRIPALIKGLVSTVFSEDAAANMGRAAATYYKELKAGGIPDDVAIRMTQDYVGMFTKISEFIKKASKGEREHEEIGEEIKRAVLKKMKKELEEEEKE